MTKYTEIAEILKATGTKNCLQKAKELDLLPRESSNLHLRNLDLEPPQVVAICQALEQSKNTNGLKSISFSYNPLFADTGAEAMVKCLPPSITEVGLVGCGITDKGGASLLSWMKSAANLRMICVEQNSFSLELRSAFRAFSAARPHILVVC